MKLTSFLPFVFLLALSFGCQVKTDPSHKKIQVLFDTDANNELDDQHALAYLYCNGNTFDVTGITVNTTRGGGNIDQQYEEARRVTDLCALPQFPIFKGANASFPEILPTIDSLHYDGEEAVQFIIQQAKKSVNNKLTLIAVGKLTNVALALAKDPSIAQSIRLVWLGSNYPDPGEYNLENDTASMNYVLNSSIELEMVTVRYGKESGTGAVSITQELINQKMPGLGPKVSTPVIGRHGKSFTCFGDYSVNLFEHIDYHGTPPSRSLFDMAAVAIVKNPTWAEMQTIPAPIYIQGQWTERPGNPRKIGVWENFNKTSILDDFIKSLEKYELVSFPQ